MGLDCKKGLTEMNKDRDVKNGIGIQMMDLNPIERKKALEEIRSRKSKTTLDEMLKQDKLINTIVRHQIRLGLSTELLLWSEVNPPPRVEAGWNQCTYFYSIRSWAVTVPASFPSEHRSSPPFLPPRVDSLLRGS